MQSRRSVAKSAPSLLRSAFCSVCAPGSSAAKHGHFLFYKPRTQDTAAEVGTRHIRVPVPILMEWVEHGRMDYRGVYGRVMCLWFANGLDWQRNESYGSTVTFCEMGH